MTLPPQSPAPSPHVDDLVTPAMIVAFMAAPMPKRVFDWLMEHVTERLNAALHVEHVDDREAALRAWQCFYRLACEFGNDIKAYADAVGEILDHDETIRNALRSEPAAMAGREWRKIETAPKNWSNLLLYEPEPVCICEDPDICDCPASYKDLEQVFQGYYSCADGGKDCWMVCGHSGEQCHPTHWQPLPPPPDSTEQQS